MKQTRATVDRSHFHEPEKGPEETPPCVPQLSATTMTVIDTFLQDAVKFDDHALIRGEMQRRNFRGDISNPPPPLSCDGVIGFSCRAWSCKLW
jgi:hypothetical protein